MAKKVCFWADRKNKMASLASDWPRYFHFSSETAERNSTKHDRNQDLNVFYQVCVFRPIRKKNKIPPGLWLAETFSTSPLKLLNEQNSTKLDRKQDLNVLYQVCVFRADWKNKIAASASDWLRHFRLLWNLRTEFNETWQEAISQRPLQSLCFSSRWPPWPFRKKMAHCTQVHDM